MLLLAGIVFNACDNYAPSGRMPSLNKRYLFVPTNSLSFEAKLSSQTLKIESEQTDWIINIPVDWVVANPMSGNSSMAVGFTTQLNNSADTSRVCIATVASNVGDWNRSFPITITQGKNTPYINLSEDDVICSAVKQTKTITVSANTEYTIDNTGSSWLHIEKTASNDVMFTIDENNTGAERNAIVVFKAKSYNGVSAIVNVRQKIANISSTKNTLTYGHYASSQTVEIESEASWTASSTSWLSVSPSSGNAGKTHVTISVPNNASVKNRTGSVYFNIAGNNNVEIPIEQEGVTLSVSPETIMFTSFGGSQSLSVSSNDSWTVTTKPGWVNVDKISGEGNSTILLSTVENNTTSEKTGVIVVSTDDGVTSKTISVKQEAKTVEYGDATLDFNYSAGSQSINFTTDGKWIVTKDADWISIDKTSGSGSATLNISVEENMTLAEREGNIELVIAGEKYLIVVHQTCKYLTLSSSAFDFDSFTGHTSISISSNTKWNVSVKESPNWITVSPGYGEGNAEITIGVSENNTPYARSAVIEVDIPDVHTYLINVTQAGKYIKVDRTSVDFTSAGGTEIINVVTDGTFEVSRPSSSWFGFTRNGNTITVVASRNDTGADRSGQLNIKMTNLSSGEYTKYIPIKQTKE